MKHLKTADCVVGGFRYGEGTKVVGSLLLGLETMKSENPFEVRVPGGPSPWASEKSCEWQPVRPELVCEVEAFFS